MNWNGFKLHSDEQILFEHTVLTGSLLFDKTVLNKIHFFDYIVVNKLGGCTYHCEKMEISFLLWKYYGNIMEISFSYIYIIFYSYNSYQSSLSHLNIPINGKFQRDPRRRNPNRRRTPTPQVNALCFQEPLFRCG
mgnify:CR=1 FL=1